MSSDCALLPVSFVADVNQLHHDMVQKWQGGNPQNEYEGVFARICEQHQSNFILWQPQDSVADIRLSVDDYTQQRDQWIEQLDESLIGLFATMGIEPAENARMNTESPGRVIDRLSILSLRVYQLSQQLDRLDLDPEQLEQVRQQLSRCRAQQRDLSQALVELLEDLLTGRKVLRIYRQMKMFGDPEANPYLYKSDEAAAA